MSAPGNPAKLTLISHHLCPYVQRAAIALAEKELPFERIWIDLAAKPGWFKAISPLGRVPVLVVKDEEGREAVIFESAVILEYLEETTASPLHPADPLRRARHRGWIEFGSQGLDAIGRLYSATDDAAFEKQRAGLSAMFARLETELGDGPYFAGERFSLVDAVFAPVFRYFDAFDRLGFSGHARRQAESGRMAQGARGAALGAGRRDGGFSGTADALPGGEAWRAGGARAGLSFTPSVRPECLARGDGLRRVEVVTRVVGKMDAIRHYLSARRGV